jgi:hypothetical protein
MDCALCRVNQRSENSHIVPAFVIRYLKRISITGHLRGGEEPNRRKTDGPKCKLLCQQCEDSFSKWEGRFASEVFHPLHSGHLDRRAFRYGDWLAKFAVSVSWRSLWHARERSPKTPLPHGHDPLVQPTLDAWRDFLLGKRADIAHHRQHLLFLGHPISLPAFLDPKELRFYIERGIDYGTVHSAQDAYIITKLCRVLIIGTIFTHKPSEWSRTQIDLCSGEYRPGDFRVPGCIFTFFKNAVDDTITSRAQISSTQRKKIEEAVADATKRFLV